MSVGNFASMAKLPVGNFAIHILSFCLCAELNGLNLHLFFISQESEIVFQHSIARNTMAHYIYHQKILIASSKKSFQSLDLARNTTK